jgi:Flp pilus assembly pilin Flp
MIGVPKATAEESRMTYLTAELHARLVRDDRGAATLDVGLAAVLLGVTTVAAVTLLGGDISTWWSP